MANLTKEQFDAVKKISILLEKENEKLRSKLLLVIAKRATETDVNVVKVDLMEFLANMHKEIDKFIKN